MIIDRLGDGRPVADTQALAALTGRPPATIRRHCDRLDTGRYDIGRCTRSLHDAPDPVLLTAADAQRYLGIPAGTVYSWVSRGELAPLDRVGRRPLYDAADLTRLQEGR